MSIFKVVGRSSPAIIQGQGLGGDERTVITIGNHIDAERAQKDRKGIHLLAPEISSNDKQVAIYYLRTHAHGPEFSYSRIQYL